MFSKFQLQIKKLPLLLSPESKRLIEAKIKKQNNGIDCERKGGAGMGLV